MINEKFFTHFYEADAFDDMKKEIRFENELKNYYEKYTLPSNTPDLYGKTVEVNEYQFKSLFEIAKDISAILEMPVPEMHVFESFYYTVESKETSNYHWIEMSSKTISELTPDEIAFLLAKELIAIKLKHTHYYALINEFLNAIRNNVSFTGIGTATAVIKMKMYSWARVSSYTSDNFAYLYCRDLRTCFNAILKTVLNDTFLAENVNILNFINQAEKINSLNDDIHNFSKSDEWAPYIPFRLKNLIAYASSSRGIDAVKYIIGGVR